MSLRCSVKAIDQKLMLSILSLLAIMFVSEKVLAEPYLAVRTGQKCSACHVNPTGGGKRTQYGFLYGKNSIAGETLIKDGKDWNGRVSDFLAFGADFRANLDVVSTPNQNTQVDFNLEELSLYLEFVLIPDHLTVNIDEKFAPGGAANLEAWALLKPFDNTAYLKAGRFYLPYGTRIQDDGAFIRQVTGVSFNNSDNGIELGFEPGAWSTALSVTNGTNGAGENNKEKQYSFRAEYITSAWRMGASYNLNEGDSNNDRELAAIFAGTQVLGIDWLFEYDQVENEGAVSGQEQDIYYLEANLGVLKGHNFKFSYEHFDPDTAIEENDQTRTSVVWEYSPFEFTQIRTGYRLYDGIPQNDAQNRDEFFVQLHNYF